jgi:hypothetical protein
MEPGGSLPCSQEPATDSYPESDESSPYGAIQYVYAFRNVTKEFNSSGSTPGFYYGGFSWFFLVPPSKFHEGSFSQTTAATQTSVLWSSEEAAALAPF